MKIEGDCTRIHTHTEVRKHMKNILKKQKPVTSS